MGEGAGPSRSAGAETKRTVPRRVVSMNLCADQLAMLVAAPGQLRSVSSMAADPHSSAMAREAAGFVINRGRAEEVFLMRPDLVIAGAFTTRATVDMLRRLGFEVAEFAPASGFDDIRADLRRMGALLGREARAEALVAELDARLEAVAADGPSAQTGPRPRAALRYANGYSSGAGTLADAITRAAGLDNIAAGMGLSGYVKLPLETLIMAEPDLLVIERPYDAPALAGETLRHPALAPLAAQTGQAASTDPRWVCGAPFTAEAAAELAAARAALPGPGETRAAR